MGRDVIQKILAKYYKKYQEIFGYISNENGYSCTRKVYAEALQKHLKKKRNIRVLKKGCQRNW